MHLLLSPLSWAVALGLLMLAPGLLRWRRWAALGWLASLVLMAPLGANGLIWLLEAHPGMPDCMATDRAPLLVLGGGLDRIALDPSDFGALTPASMRRVATAVAVAGRSPGVAVIFSGGAGDMVTEAELMAHLASRLGLASQSVRTERQSTSTWENARAVAALESAAGAKVQLITSDHHAARASLALRLHGVWACRHPADSLFTPFSGPGHLVPQSSALVKAEKSLHEMVGMAAYRVRAWARGHAWLGPLRD